MNDPLFEIEDDVSDMNLIIGKGMVALNAVMQDYFGKTEVSSTGLANGPSFKVLDTYAKYNTIAEIAFDYINDLEHKLNALSKRISELRKESGTAAPDNSTLSSVLAMLRQIKDPATIKRIYDFSYRLFIKESAPAAPTTKADKPHNG